MLKKGVQKVPDAWDDADWETKADVAAKEAPKEKPAPALALSKPERMALHRESNRKLWQSADTPAEPFHFLEASNTVPLATTNLKPQVKVLARKPSPPRDPATGMADLSLGDGSEDEEEAVRRHKIAAEARMLEGKRLLEGKQKAYEEARRRIFGDDKEDEARRQGQAARGSGRGRGGRGPARARGRGGSRGGEGRGSETSRSAASSRSATPSRTATPSATTRELYDPNHSPKPPSNLQRSPAKDGDSRAPAAREPRGPDGSGRGGFGFARRGGL